MNRRMSHREGNIGQDSGQDLWHPWQTCIWVCFTDDQRHRRNFLCRIWVSWGPILQGASCCLELLSTLQDRAHSRHWFSPQIQYTENVPCVCMKICIFILCSISFVFMMCLVLVKIWVYIGYYTQYTIWAYWRIYQLYTYNVMDLIFHAPTEIEGKRFSIWRVLCYQNQPIASRGLCSIQEKRK